MPMTSAERQRLYRQRLKQNNPEKYEEIRKKNLERIKSKYIAVSKLSENQKNLRRKNWRDFKKNRNRKTEENKPKSRKIYFKHYYNLKKRNENQKRKIEKQRKTIAALKKKIYRQKILLECQKPENETLWDSVERTGELTPNSKTNLFIENLSNTISEEDKENVRREILQNNVFSQAFTNEYKDSNSNAERNILKNVCNSVTARRYKMRTRLGYILGLKGRIRCANKNLLKKRSYLAKKIQNFFLQDDVSRATAGKKETRTLKKFKVQKRYLQDSMKNLHQKFKNDIGINISYTTFIRNKPFFVVKPKIADRYTCVCKIHANMEFKFIALRKLNIINSCYELNDLVEKTVCDKRSMECMYSECDVCNEIPIEYDFTHIDKNEHVSWLEWLVKEIRYDKNNETKKTKRVLTEIKSDKLKNFLLLLEKDLKKFKIHVFNVSHQYKSYKNLKENLDSNEIILHCDFSENYTCKMHKEIQAVHFGASQFQISLHTSVVYKKNIKPLSFCSLSDSTNHSPEAIWAHLKPVLTDLKEHFPEVKNLHVFSDGPSTQYKQKKNFYLFKKMLDEIGFEIGTWNFSESYHGKGPADGVGGNIKRLLDEKVAYGKDVLNAITAYSLLKNETSVKLFCIDDSEISEIRHNNESAFDYLTAVPHTQKIHQIQVVNDDSYDIYHRILSCFCNSSLKRGLCDCFSIKKHCLIKFPSKKRLRKISSSDPEEDVIVRLNSSLFTPISTSSPAKQIKAGSDSGCDIFDRPKPIKKCVTILSNVKVNYTKNDLQKILKNSARFNVSSTDLKTDFPMLCSTTNTSDSLVKKHAKKPFNFFDSSDSE